MTATSESLLDKPMARIATGWRMQYVSNLPYSWAVYSDARHALIWFGKPTEALAEYMRLTQVPS